MWSLASFWCFWFERCEAYTSAADCVCSASFCVVDGESSVLLVRWLVVFFPLCCCYGRSTAASGAGLRSPRANMNCAAIAGFGGGTEKGGYGRGACSWFVSFLFFLLCFFGCWFCKSTRMGMNHRDGLLAFRQAVWVATRPRFLGRGNEKWKAVCMQFAHLHLAWFPFCFSDIFFLDATHKLQNNWHLEVLIGMHMLCVFTVYWSCGFRYVYLVAVLVCSNTNAILVRSLSRFGGMPATCMAQKAMKAPQDMMHLPRYMVQDRKFGFPPTWNESKSSLQKQFWNKVMSGHWSKVVDALGRSGLGWVRGVWGGGRQWREEIKHMILKIWVMSPTKKGWKTERREGVSDPASNCLLFGLSKTRASSYRRTPERLKSQFRIQKLECHSLIQGRMCSIQMNSLLNETCVPQLKSQKLRKLQQRMMSVLEKVAAGGICWMCGSMMSMISMMWSWLRRFVGWEFFALIPKTFEIRTMRLYQEIPQTLIRDEDRGVDEMLLQPQWRIWRLWWVHGQHGNPSYPGSGGWLWWVHGQRLFEIWNLKQDSKIFHSYYYWWN